MRVRVAAQVADLVRRMAPEPRRRLRRALRDLEKGKGDIRPLEGPLQEYFRLRAGPYRVILSYGPSQTVDCIFAERRGIVYEIFADAMVERLMRDE
jgi:mRNA-degrading endonuclease RelE of RelBE toxin-antitoxin system